MATELQIPLVLARDLPEVTGTPDATTQMVVIQGNSNTARMSWGNATAHFLQSADDVPAGESAEGVQNAIAVGEDGVYTFSDGQWGKAPRYTSNWADLTSDSRFLLVNSSMNLTEEEQANVRNSIGLTIASEYISPTIPGTLGLIKGSSSVQINAAGVATVPTATATSPGLVQISDTENGLVAASTGYVDTKIQGVLDNPVIIPIATDTSLGGVMASDTVQIDDNGEASVNVAQAGVDGVGLVNLAGLDTYTDAQLGWAAPVQLVLNIADDRIQQQIAVATRNSKGVVTPTGAIIITQPTVGGIDVQTASTSQKGIVQLINSVTASNADTTGYAVTAKAVRDYVSNQSTSVQVPIATATTVGGILVGSTTVKLNSANQAYVPTASSSSAGVVRVAVGSSDTAPSTVPSLKYMTDYINSVKTSIPTATPSRYGTVRIQAASSESSASAFTVPSVAYTQSLIESGGSTSPTYDSIYVTGNGSFRSITSGTVVNPDDNAVLNYGQLKTLFQAISSSI